MTEILAPVMHQSELDGGAGWIHGGNRALLSPRGTSPIRERRHRRVQSIPRRRRFPVSWFTATEIEHKEFRAGRAEAVAFEADNRSGSSTTGSTGSTGSTGRAGAESPRSSVHLAGPGEDTARLNLQVAAHVFLSAFGDCFDLMRGEYADLLQSRCHIVVLDRALGRPRER